MKGVQEAYQRHAISFSLFDIFSMSFRVTDWAISMSEGTGDTGFTGRAVGQPDAVSMLQEDLDPARYYIYTYNHIYIIYT